MTTTGTPAPRDTRADAGPQLGDIITTSASAITGTVIEVAESTRDGRHVRVCIEIVEPDGSSWSKWTMVPTGSE